MARTVKKRDVMKKATLPAPSKALAAILDHVRSGGTLFVPSYTRCVVIDSKTIKRFDRAGLWLLKEDGDGYRMRMGRSSVYLFPGQLQMMY